MELFETTYWITKRKIRCDDRWVNKEGRRYTSQSWMVGWWPIDSLVLISNMTQHGRTKTIDTAKRVDCDIKGFCQNELR